MGLQFLFMDDNAPCHRTVAAEQLLESEDIERMDWLARSPDLNPIEPLWDFLGRRLAARTLPPVRRFTVARRLPVGGLFARRPVRCVPLTPAHRRRPSLWCREHRNWRDNEWGRIIKKLICHLLSYGQKKQAADSGRNRGHTTQATGRPISRFTGGRRLHGGGLFAPRAVRCVPLTPAHRRRRSLWWGDNEWGRVLITDESRFSLSSDSHRILIWRERGSRNHLSNIIERDRYGGRGVLVWGGIMLGSRTDLHIFDAGSVNGTRYCNEILLQYVRLF
ncbi:transposable element Tcb2 transposase [Trichonephila clavipes]|nr:transposable element Tcb2 transposase [Trichonephila clavipes]